MGNLSSLNEVPGRPHSSTIGELTYIFVFLFLTYFTLYNRLETLLYSTGNPARHSDDLEGWGEGSGGRQYMCNRVVAGQKPSQCGKAIFLQLKNQLKNQSASTC